MSALSTFSEDPLSNFSLYFAAKMYNFSQTDLEWQLEREDIEKSQRAHVGRVLMRFHIVFGCFILLANGYLIGFYIKYPRLRRHVGVTMLAAFIAIFLQVSILK